MPLTDQADSHAAALTRSRVRKMANQAPEFDGRARANLPRDVFARMAVLVTAILTFRAIAMKSNSTVKPTAVTRPTRVF
jgi:hypothetical protein